MNGKTTRVSDRRQQLGGEALPIASEDDFLLASDFSPRARSPHERVETSATGLAGGEFFPAASADNFSRPRSAFPVLAAEKIRRKENRRKTARKSAGVADSGARVLFAVYDLSRRRTARTSEAPPANSMSAGRSKSGGEPQARAPPRRHGATITI
jgi:hypothetical protein